MNIIRIRLVSFTRGLLLSCGMVAFMPAQQATPQITVETRSLSGPVSMMTATEEGDGSGNLVFSAGPDGILLVDAFTTRWAPGIREALDRRSKQPVKFIVNTHFHGDHVGGNQIFGPQATVLAHPNVRKKMSIELHPPWRERPTPPRPPHAWPVITYEERVSLHFNGEEIRLIPFPRSHTDSDTVVFFTGSRVVAIGDLMYVLDGQLGPVSDQWSGGDMQSLAQHLSQLVSQLPPDVKVVPGHGRTFTLGELEAYHRIMTRTLEVVRERIAAGKNLEQIVGEGLPGELLLLGDWQVNVREWLENAHQSLTRQPGITEAGIGQASSPQAGQHERVVIESEGWKIVGDLLVPRSARPVPAVLMLNGAALDRTPYRELADQLARLGIASLRVDLRGHGESTNLGKFVPYQTISLLDESDRDVAAALELLRGDKRIDPARVGLVGASYSGEAMMVAGKKSGYAAAYVALSPGSLSDESIAAIDEHKLPWLLVVSRHERHLKEVAQALRDQSRTAEFLELGGTEHATRLLGAHSDLSARIAVWFRHKLAVSD